MLPKNVTEKCCRKILSKMLPKNVAENVAEKCCRVGGAVRGGGGVGAMVWGDERSFDMEKIVFFL